MVKEYKDWLFVTVGKQICNPRIGSQSLIYINSSDYSGPIVRVPLVGSYQIIGKGDAINWEEIVDGWPTQSGNNLYKVYNRVGGGFLTATESGHSLLKSLGMEPSETLVLKKNEK